VKNKWSPRLDKFWWLRRGKYVAVFLRELSSVFILLYVLLYLWILSGANGEATTVAREFGTAPFLVISLVFLAFSVYNSITWFFLFSKVTPNRFGPFELKKNQVVVLQVVVFLLLSFLVGFLVYGVLL
jgi:fumarate reductase subunit C